MDERTYKVVTLRGRPWRVWKNSYRFYIQPVDGGTLASPCLEFKHDDILESADLAELLFLSLPDMRADSASDRTNENAR